MRAAKQLPAICIKLRLRDWIYRIIERIKSFAGGNQTPNDVKQTLESEWYGIEFILDKDILSLPAIKRLRYQLRVLNA